MQNIHVIQSASLFLHLFAFLRKLIDYRKGFFLCLGFEPACFFITLLSSIVSFFPLA